MKTPETAQMSAQLSRPKLALLAFAILLVTTLFLYAQGAATEPVEAAKHGPMELFGMGPEMWQDRAVAWVKAISTFVKEIVSELGIIAAAIYAFWANLKTRQEIKETRKETAERFSEHGRRITEVALAAQPNAMPVHEVTKPEVITPGPTP